MNRRLHILQHVFFEGQGTIEHWANINKMLVTRTKFFNKDWSLPAISDFDLLVIMGGPMNVDEEYQYPWLSKEKQFIQQAIEADKKILGICLGAQLIASVMGARVYRNKQKEIGWFDVEMTADAKRMSIINSFPDSFCAFHWHGDTYDLPDKAYRLFYSEACEQQGFLIGPNILGLQFHIEVDANDILAFIANNTACLTVSGPFVQTPDQIRNDLSKAEWFRPVLFELMSSFMQLTSSQLSLQATEG